MSRILDPTPDEVSRALALTYVNIQSSRNFTTDRDQSGYTLAMQVLQRMCAAKRLDVVMAYAEANRIIYLGQQIVAMPVVNTRDAMISSLLQLHHAFGILNHWVADAMDDPDFINKHWAVTPEITPDVDFNTWSPITFRIDLARTERLMLGTFNQITHSVRQADAVAIDIPAVGERSERVEKLVKGKAGI